MNLLSLLSAGAVAGAAAEAVTETQAIETASQNMTSMMNNGMTIGEKAMNALEMTGIGMGTVFLVLIILWGALELFQYVFYTLPSKKIKSAEITAGESVQTIVDEAPSAVAEEPVNTADDAAIIAAISAAIAAYEDKPISGFRVVSFKRAGRKTGWSRYGE